MNAAVRGPRSTPTWLTGTAGLLVLVVALVMMVLAAPTGASPASPHSAPQHPALSPGVTLSVAARHVPGPPATRHDRSLRDLGLQ